MYVSVYLCIYVCAGAAAVVAAPILFFAVVPIVVVVDDVSYSCAEQFMRRKGSPFPGPPRRGSHYICPRQSHARTIASSGAYEISTTLLGTAFGKASSLLALLAKVTQKPAMKQHL